MKRDPDLDGLSVRVDADGMWLVLRDSRGRSAVLSAAGIANACRGAMTAEVVAQWCADRRAGAGRAQ